MNLNKLLRIILSFTLVLFVSAVGFYYPMFKEAIGIMPDMNQSKKIKGCKDSEQIQCWEKVINENIEKEYFFPTKQSLVMNYFLYYQYEVQKISDLEDKINFTNKALTFMSSALNKLEIELNKEKAKPFSNRDLFFPFAQFYRFAQLSLASDTIELSREKVISYYKKFEIIK